MLLGMLHDLIFHFNLDLDIISQLGTVTIITLFYHSLDGLYISSHDEPLDNGSRIFSLAL